jgi:hypothetical protein
MKKLLILVFLITGCEIQDQNITTTSVTPLEVEGVIDTNPCASIPANNPANKVWCVSITGEGAYSLNLYTNDFIVNGVMSAYTNKIESVFETVSAGETKVYSLEGPNYFTTHNGSGYQGLHHISGSFEITSYKNQKPIHSLTLNSSYTNFVYE